MISKSATREPGCQAILCSDCQYHKRMPIVETTWIRWPWRFFGIQVEVRREVEKDMCWAFVDEVTGETVETTCKYQRNLDLRTMSIPRGLCGENGKYFKRKERHGD